MPRNKLTKKKIFFAAIDSFAEKGFKNCTMQEIADKVNIKAPSIYKHFANKKEILTDIFDYYKENFNKHRLPAEKITEAIDNEPIGKVFPKLFITFETEDEYTLMMKISKIVIEMSHKNKDAQKVFKATFIEEPTKYLDNIFTKLIGSGRLKHFDYETLTFLMVSFSVTLFELTASSGTVSKETEKKYSNGIAMLASGFEKADLLLKKPNLVNVN